MRLRILAGLFLSFMVGLSPLHAENSPNLSFIRDAEIEHYMRELATPIWRAAAIEPTSVSIVLVQDSAINAFVAGGMNIFFYTGLLQLADTPEQLAGVIAHETGHISGGHLARGSEAARHASAEAILGMLLGVAAGVASGSGQVAAGAIGGAQNVVERNFLSFSRMQEGTADAAGMSFLDKAGMTTRGMMEFMQKLGAQDILPVDRQVEYVRTHPLTQNRMDALEGHLKDSPHAKTSLDSRFAGMHARMKAKLVGFLQPETALLRYTDKDPRREARYARAIALYRTGELSRALGLTDDLIREEPKNPFFVELKAQMLFDNGRIEEAITLYKKAVDLLPNSALLRVSYGHALLESKDDANLNPAIQNFLEANRLEDRQPETWRFLASAWGRKAEKTKNMQDEGLVSYALAEEAAAKGADKQAKHYAERALKNLTKGSSYWLRAQDIKISVTTAKP